MSEFVTDQCLDLAAALTYYAMLSIFPAMIALVSILSLVGQQSLTDQLVDLVSAAVPDSAMSTLEPVITSLTNAPAPGVGLLVGLLAALWTASNYVNAFSRAMNRVYGVTEGRPIWKLRPAMYGLTVLMLLLVAVATSILVLSGPVARAVGELVGLGSAAITVWSIVKWPVLLAIVVVVIALLYYATPNVKQPRFRWISLGAIIAIVAAALASTGLGLYVANFAKYATTYGALAGVIIFLLWLWIMNLALLLGAEFDAELERGRQLQAGLPAEDTLQLPARDTRAAAKRAAREEKDRQRARELRTSGGRSAGEHADREQATGQDGVH
ncbi:YihY/virulence factor BrkB family protein [Ruania albidiflava]|uniref:YihY/virulence factor BrkB family protein n=1 Tax=Ruania albidiflava TaxID=366586 RepID=UPI001FE14062|nr:YihY/virulence factor BrkB family protein [Ruania albidiflava]